MAKDYYLLLIFYISYSLVKSLFSPVTDVMFFISGILFSSASNPMNNIINIIDFVEEDSTDLQKTYECSCCSRTFMQRYALKQHFLTHTGERPFVCQICQKTFTQLGSLNRHMVIHEGIKPFKCTFCDYSANQLISLKIHISNKH